MTADKQALQALVDEFEMPEQLGFGNTMVPVMFRADYADGQWSAGELLPYGPIAIDPATSVLHYAQEVFEGMKAYWVDNETPSLFRPDRNADRLSQSALTMSMPALPEDLFMRGVNQLVDMVQSLIPRQQGTSLYIRPFMFATDVGLGLPAVNHCSFYVIASPSEAYQAGNMRVLVEREGARAPYGTVGSAKTGGNYAASSLASAQCKDKGFHQVMWLNSSNRSQIDELSGMNFFAVIDGQLYTPALNGSILPGITRDSIVSLAKDEGLTVHECCLDVDDVLAAIEDGRCSEAFAVGTAAIVTPISAIGDGYGKEYNLAKPDGDLSQRFRQQLLGLQEGRVEDRFGWIQSVS